MVQNFSEALKIGSSQAALKKTVVYLNVFIEQSSKIVTITGIV